MSYGMLTTDNDTNCRDVTSGIRNKIFHTEQVRKSQI